jgi:fructose-1,6-bisphosphatase/inositol monophosphatase family enzyme
MISHPEQVVDRLKEFQGEVRNLLIRSRSQKALHTVDRQSIADTIYAIDSVVEPVLESFCDDWARTTPLILIAEGLENEDGTEGSRTFPRGTAPEDAEIQLIIDPIDGTRGLMYDKRSAWALAGVAPNKGSATRLRDIEVAVMTELPTSKLGYADVLWAIKGQGAVAERVELDSGVARSLSIQPSSATTLDHGFASVTSFFPGTKVIAAELMEQLVQELLGPLDVTRPTVFDDQYISTGGQLYEMIMGHDRFNADLRPLFHRIQNQPEGLCCHPYDCACLLIAEEAGIIVTNGLGQPLDGPLDVTTGLSWAIFANPTLRKAIEPLLTAFLKSRGIV